MKKESRCAMQCNCHNNGRRDFLKNTAFIAAGATLMGKMAFSLNIEGIEIPVIKAYGEASKYVPLVKAAFVRRREENFGVRWPGAIYDVKEAKKKYSEQLSSTAKSLGVNLDLRESPIYDLNEADAWLKEAGEKGVDGLMLMLLDRQEHAWPTAQKAAESGIPLVIFSPLGTSFTTNTVGLAKKTGCVIYSTDDFSQVAYGMKMLRVKAKMNHTRCVVIAGKEKGEKN